MILETAYLQKDFFTDMTRETPMRQSCKYHKVKLSEKSEEKL